MNSLRSGKNRDTLQSDKINYHLLKQRLARAPVNRVQPAGDFFQAGVILPLYEKGREPYILTVLKTKTPGYPWSDQVAFPGGHVDEADETSLDAALREISEELCITQDHLAVAGSIGQFFTIRETVVECFLALWDNDRSCLRFDPTEISEIIEVPVKTLREIHESSGFPGRIPDTGELQYQFDGIVIWGVTARMIHFMLEHVLI